MANDQTKSPAELEKACHEAFKEYPKSCSHAVWHVIKQYKSDQNYMIANDLVDHLARSSDWKEVQLSELSKLASDGVLVVGGLKGKTYGHVIAIYPGQEKTKGGYFYTSKKTGKKEFMAETGLYARAMSTSIGARPWPGTISNGDKTVADVWSPNDFESVKFWKYVGATNSPKKLLTHDEVVQKLNIKGTPAVKAKLKSKKKKSYPVKKGHKGVAVHPWLDELKNNANSIFDRIGIGRVF